MSAFRRDFVRGQDVVSVTLRHLRGDLYQVHVGDAVHEIEASRLPDGRVRYTLDGQSFEADSAPCGKTLQVRVGGRTWRLDPAGGRARAAEAGGGLIEAPMTGTIGQVLVRAGDRVDEGAPIVVLTAMKMEHKLTAGIAGVVTELRAEVGATVDEGTVLARIEPDADDADDAN